MLAIVLLAVCVWVGIVALAVLAHLLGAISDGVSRAFRGSYPRGARK